MTTGPTDASDATHLFRIVTVTGNIPDTGVVTGASATSISETLVKSHSRVMYRTTCSG